MMVEWGKFLLRLAIGGLLLFHGIHKIIHGIGGVQAMLAAHSLPAWIGYGVYVGEVLAPVALIVGLRPRIAALVIAFNMAAAIALAYGGKLFALGMHGGWIVETPLLYFAGALAIAMIGGGRIGLKW
ncbi:DoxX family protein [Hydrogenimonas cancrithermarum]|uniref:GntR family transcriptional regulator n=1 Tax=Hydrogenimonas cancrithermarum TaxID=2993563 RepID=A0ABM8FLD2_9BACT|nr:DoxX family protein [Hydrogenimonas cancrithermarum]BDY13107.1 GntR family transcriptional regulator [Hydrogenimonas cancrithermarum]